MDSMLHVSAAVIMDKGRIFAAQKKAGGWEFPGGKQEEGEDALQTAVREIQEEFGTTIEAERLLFTIEHKDLVMDCVLCHIVDGGLEPREHLSTKWLSLDELEALDWLPADRIVAARLPAVLG